MNHAPSSTPSVFFSDVFDTQIQNQTQHKKQHQQLNHLLDHQQLTTDLIHSLLNQANFFHQAQQNQRQSFDWLNQKTVCHLFFENSTRTRSSFELAAQRLSARVLNLSLSQSSTQKGESVLDTVDTLAAMGVDLFVIRHEQNGLPHQVAAHLDQKSCFAGRSLHVVNAGDGKNAHPTQALLDAFTLFQHHPRLEDWSQLSIAIVGDVLHSRVARSNIAVLSALGVRDIRLVAPPSLLPASDVFPQVSLHQQLDPALEDVDVIMTLRLQKERMNSELIPDVRFYFDHYGITPQRLQRAKPNAKVMHPGPLNRGIEIDSAVADGAQSLILQQVQSGVLMRMAVLQYLLADLRMSPSL